MPVRPTVESLCAKNKNENVHSQYVCVLALEIFDAVAYRLRLPLMLRPLLRAAALLHDVGYFEKPTDHQTAGAGIIARKGLASFTEEQSRIVAATILLHRKDYAKAYGVTLFEQVEDKETALRLGAILRIADGLDHGHMQNASIISVKPFSGGFLLTVASPGYDGNISYARSKADLWKKVFHKEIRIVDAPGRRALAKFSGIVRHNDGVLDTARRLLYLHYRILSENYQGMMAGKFDDPLHDGRIAMRRFRAVLRLFSRFLPVASVVTIDTRLAALALALSPIRDNDVWMTFLSSKQIANSFRGNIEFVHFHALQSRLRKGDKRTVRNLLNDPEYAALMRDINRFLRVELPQKVLSPQYPTKPFLARRLCAMYFEILSRHGVRKKYDVAEMHKLRKLCRRARYFSEFAEPVLGRPARQLARHCNALADVLGDIHDADMAIERLSGLKPPIALQLVKHAHAEKRKQLVRFHRVWQAHRSPIMLYAATTLWREAKSDVTLCYLVRHATAAKDSGGEQRTLDKQGIEEAHITGRALSLMQCRPRIIASSPLARAFDTASIIAGEFSFSAPVSKKTCLSANSDVGETLQWLSGQRGPSCVCVGHMPHLERLAAALLRKSESDPISFTRASACCISFEHGIAAGQGTLEWYFSGKKLKRIVGRISGE
jgi:CHAD domain-containing protein/phosphohistidine phosphatase SixA